MDITCTADITISDDGKYINAVSVRPVAGVRFNFKPINGAKLTAGHYFIKGTLNQSTGVSNKGEGGPRQFTVLNVLGEAVKGSTAFTPDEPQQSGKGK